ncbi:hypothetical protein [Yersinia frederiksenii]|uniref:Uncharacterized protein n=1 Tax=Yersinia frederiksenii TaxID=29484 RepID=A0AAI8ZR88_YERFR|nr:hypothetical protein [Yersinia frederiksenii]CFR01012.1 Uncharacterised protein [Yersinia frederiksenii]
MNKLNEHELQSIFENFSECPVVIRAVDEMLSLREQLAELKSLEPLGYIDPRTLADDGCSGGTWMKRQPREIGPYTMPLFTAAKPEALPRHIYSMLVNELRDVPAIGCKRELIVGVLNRHGITAAPVQCDPPATK